MGRRTTRRADAPSPVTWERLKNAPATAILAIAATALSVSYIAAAPETWEEVSRWGYLPATEIWSGKIWPLWSSALLHADFLHLAFNVYWLWFFGSHLEPHLGRLKFLALCILGTFVSSCAELAAANATGVGLSGLVYAFFGYAWLAPREDEALASLMSRQTVVWMVGWLFLCLVLTETGTYDIGNAAHFAGIAFGGALGFGQRKHLALGLGGAGVLVGASVVVLFWCPWSVEWLGNKAYAAFEAGEDERGSDYVARILEIDPSDEWALGRKRQTELRATPKPLLEKMLATAKAGDPKTTKAQLAEEMMKFGSIRVQFDPSASGVSVPVQFREQSTLVLEFGRDMPSPIPDLAVGPDAISGTLSFDGQPFHCSVEWSAVTALVLDDEHQIAWD